MDLASVSSFVAPCGLRLTAHERGGEQEARAWPLASASPGSGRAASRDSLAYDLRSDETTR